MKFKTYRLMYLPSKGGYCWWCVSEYESEFIMANEVPLATDVVEGGGTFGHRSAALILCLPEGARCIIGTASSGKRVLYSIT